MKSPAETRTLHFYAWEARGRGRRSYPYPVSLEPPFTPFRYLKRTAEVDDGRRHTGASRFLEQLFGKRGESLPAPTPEIEEDELGPYEGKGSLVEVKLLPPSELAVTPALSEGFLKGLSALRSRLSFELCGSKKQVSLVMSAESPDAPLLSSQIRAFFPSVEVEEEEELLLRAWEEGGAGVFSVVEFGLAREFMLPLSHAKSFSPDPLTGIVAALAEAGAGEVALLQILFEGVRAPWSESILRSVTTPGGEPFFANSPEITSLAREKASMPLFAVVVRAAVRAASEERVWTILRGISGALSGASAGKNELVPLGGGNPVELLGDFVFRTTHRPGALLSLPELSTLVHLPGASVGNVIREGQRTKHAPLEVQGTGIFLGYNRERGKECEARLPLEARMRHVHVIGASGTGKSTLLVSMILEDIKAGRGLAVIDPHGDLIDLVLGLMPENRTEDVILFDPADPDYAVGWNILSAHSESEKEMLASDLVAVFQRLSTSWGDVMSAVLANAILAFLESNRGGTLSDLRRFLADAAYRRDFLSTVRDPHTRDFWTTEFPLITGKPQGSILTRLDTLLRSRLVRGVVTAREKPLDFREIVDRGRVFLAKLSQGAIGEENAALLGSLLVSKLHQVSLLRQDQDEGERRPFFLYLDEFHNLATPSMASLFSGARKYRLGLIVAHQDLYQLHRTVPEVERSVLANAYTRVCFRLGEEDAKTLSQGFSFFTASDLGNLGTGEAIVRVGRKEQDFNLRTLPIGRGSTEALKARRKDIRARSLAAWGVRRETEEQAEKPFVPEKPRTEALPSRVLAPPVEVREVTAPASESSTTPPLQASPPEPRRPGKGGAEHTYLQELVKRWAEEQGFRAAVEEQIPGTRESIDVALYRGETRIACEITVTTPLEYEAGNVEKCLAAGFGKVAVISLKKPRIEKLAKLLSSSLPPESFKRVHFFTPEELLSFLAEEPTEERQGEVRGYKVKVRYRNPGDDRLKRVAEIVARSMSGLQKDE